MLTIVTSRSYLLCEAINSITLQYNPDHVNRTKVIPFYDIYIDFVPQSRGNNNNQNRSDESCHLTIRVSGEKVALKVYKEIVSQIREQMPDQVYLDKMLEEILSGGKDIHDESSETSVRKARKTKGRGKAILRKTASSNTRRKR